MATGVKSAKAPQKNRSAARKRSASTAGRTTLVVPARFLSLPVSHTVGDVLRFLMPDCLKLGRARKNPTWPPDAFALAAVVLKVSGAYTEVVTDWPPSNKAALTWHNEIDAVAKEWLLLDPSSNAWPAKVEAWWRVVISSESTPLPEVAKNRKLIEALVGVLAACDQVCAGFGLLLPESKINQYDLLAIFRLLRTKSLGVEVPPSKAVVLPKFHNPMEGMTIRSLSHNLALWMNREVRARWETAPIFSGYANLNVLVVPWPMKIEPSAFREVTDIENLRMPRRFGMFTFAPPTKKLNVTRVSQLVKKAEERVGRVDAVIFPELSMSDDDFDRLRRKLAQALLIAGVGQPAAGGALGVNKVRIGIRWSSNISRKQQHKHHRWRLEQSQICQYGLGGSLANRDGFWEATDIRERECSFFGANEWFTFCALICEDLARQDPVAELVRSVGPNLVVALLMDGPQVPERWSARYATVLADDPRSSVLTLTCAGLVDLAMSQGNRGPRSIGLWKDAKSSMPHNIVLDPDAEGVVLCLSRKMEREWTADGRHDGGKTGYLQLAGIHQISVTS